MASSMIASAAGVFRGLVMLDNTSFDPAMTGTSFRPARAATLRAAAAESYAQVGDHDGS